MVVSSSCQHHNQLQPEGQQVEARRGGVTIPANKEMPMAGLNLVPAPRSLTESPGEFALPEPVYNVLQPHPAARDLFAAERFEIEVEALTGIPFHLAVAAEMVHREREIRAVFDETIQHDQGYRLTITPDGVELRAKTAAGTFYAFQTLT